ncbi:hypothetical protein B0H19DRAFT_1069348 [Mycena capillaripes]|nr:hypothetical protein B0H19DRAFT_1069348 [Mycena capillaripes]
MLILDLSRDLLDMPDINLLNAAIERSKFWLVPPHPPCISLRFDLRKTEVPRATGTTQKMVLTMPDKYTPSDENYRRRAIDSLMQIWLEYGFKERQGYFLSSTPAVILHPSHERRTSGEGYWQHFLNPSGFTHESKEGEKSAKWALTQPLRCRSAEAFFESVERAPLTKVYIQFRLGVAKVTSVKSIQKRGVYNVAHAKRRFHKLTILFPGGVKQRNPPGIPVDITITPPGFPGRVQDITYVSI